MYLSFELRIFIDSIIRNKSITTLSLSIDIIKNIDFINDLVNKKSNYR